ncbi:MAG TPA: cereblon family protein [Acidimicrobiales bacterium]|nr:cereblon family protein [Acidimicrobiales bacterium]
MAVPAPGPTVPMGEVEADELVEPEHDDRIRCTQCRAVVTRGTLAVERDGAHEHTFRNPAGYSWTIRCFRDAGGCTSAGALTAEASWFAGYQWRYAVCATCGRHLGWWFVGSGPSFVALIARRVTQGG